MGTVSLSGVDTIRLKGKVGQAPQDFIITNTADGMVAEITFPNENVSLKNGIGGNAIYGYNAQGSIADMKLRVIRGSADDKVLNAMYNDQNASSKVNPATSDKTFAYFTLMTASLTKVLGDGAGNITNDTYTLNGGVFSKPVEVKSSVNGEEEQSVSIYTFRFSSFTRAIGVA